MVKYKANTKQQFGKMAGKVIKFWRFHSEKPQNFGDNFTQTAYNHTILKSIYLTLEKLLKMTYTHPKL